MSSLTDSKISSRAPSSADSATGSRAATDPRAVIGEVMDDYQEAAKSLPHGVQAQVTKYFRSHEANRAWAVEALARRMQPALDRVSDGALVLDAGCGFGLQSCVFGRAGARVIGVDMKRYRIAVATAVAQQLEVDASFSVSPIGPAMELLEPGTVSVIWAHRVISHFFPVGEFLLGCRNALRPDGVLVVSANNGWNPMRVIEYRRTGGGDLRRWRDADGTNASVSDGGDRDGIVFAKQELYSPRQLGTAAQTCGLRVLDVHHHGFLGEGARVGPLAASLQTIDSGLAKAPGVRRLSGSYTLVAGPVERD